MSTSPAVSKLEAKSHDAPDETRTPPKTKVEVVRLTGFTIGRFNFEPGWRWSECVQPVAGTASWPYDCPKNATRRLAATPRISKMEKDTRSRHARSASCSVAGTNAARYWKPSGCTGSKRPRDLFIHQVRHQQP